MRRLTCALLCAAALLPAMPASAPAQTRERDALILSGGGDTIFTVEGRYRLPPDLCPARRERVLPLLAKYRGQLEIEQTSDGTMRVINELSFSNYLRGLAEVPLSWPSAALRAQIIAARSYALDAYQKGRAGARSRGYHICSTDACQVYRGATIELGAFGDRWVRAVEATRGRVLRYGDDVIQSFYFSTSDGHTRSSFPGGTPQPWLPSVDGEDDDAPLAHWTARFPLDDLAVILDAAGVWAGGRITRVTRSGETLTFRGPAGSRSISTSDFRIDMNNTAICEFPNRYPSPTGTQTGTKLPQTIPSTSFTVAQNGGALVLRGRGWGHFVGMSQWGARSLAERGRSHAEILRHYYGPARIRRIDEPGSIRVLASENLRLVRISIDGPAQVRTATGSEIGDAREFEVRGGDRLQIFRGLGPRLRGVLEVRPRTKTVSAAAGQPAAVRFETSGNARVTATIEDGDGTVLSTTRERSFVFGRHRLRVPLVDEAGTPLAAGSYAIVLEAYDGLDRARSRPVRLTVLGAAVTPTPTGDAPPVGTVSRTVPIALAVALGVLALLGLAWAVRRRQPKVNV